jgi:hypothetical protein
MKYIQCHSGKKINRKTRNTDFQFPVGPGLLASDNLQLTTGQMGNIQMGNRSNIRLGNLRVLLHIWLDIKVGN